MFELMISVVRFPWQLIDEELSAKFCWKKSENDQSPNASQSFKIKVKAVKLLGQILRSI